jgi:FkbM family methyltransferase
MAQKIFPNAVFHLVEPQPACRHALQTLSAMNGFIIHECALADKEGKVRLTQTNMRSTGARIELDDQNSIPVVAATLDSLFGSITRNERPLLKLDLQGYELTALRGGTEFLRSVEVILTEVSFYTQLYDPLVGGLVSFLNDNGLHLYEIASLSGRSRDNRLRQGDFIFVRTGSSLLEDVRWE